MATDGGEGFKRQWISSYFSLLGEILMDHNLVDKPSQIYNVNESGVSLDPKSAN